MYSQLKQAIRYNQLSKFTELLNNNELFNINEKDDRGKTLLHYAVHQGPDYATLLLKKNADVTITDQYGNTPLHLAIRSHYAPKIITSLRESGANVYAENTAGETPISIVTQLGYQEHYEEVCALLGDDIS